MSEPASPYADPAFATRFAAFALACWFSHDSQWFLRDGAELESSRA